MSSFAEILDRAFKRHGKPEMQAHLEASVPKSSAELSAIPDNRWLSQATRCVFQAGFNWKVIEAKWDGFETAFEGFDIGRWVLANDDDIARLVGDKRIVRNPQKIRTVPENARFIAEISNIHNGFGTWISQCSPTERNLLLEELNKRGSRLGAMTGQYFLRFLGADCYILSRDVTAALVHQGIIDKQPTSKKAMAAVQEAFNGWMDDSGYTLTQISRVLARSIDG
ncbi:MAG: DNA-3-methyladenine glycosylase I [Rhizobiaceae bacterium]